VKKAGWGVLALAVAALPVTGHAVGVEGPAEAQTRLGAGLGAGVDQVGGYGRDAFVFLEAFGHAEGRIWRWLTLGASVTVRQDVAGYNHALEAWRGGSPSLIAQLTVGYDGPGFALSVGPWLYADARDGRPFSPALLPYGVLKLRVGALDAFRVLLRLGDGAPFTAEGAGLSARLMLGLPRSGAHRVSAGLYTTLGEATAGVTVTDEVEGLTASGRLRFGATLGVDTAHLSRVELMAFGGLVY
jgi:hypothetical protein